MDELWACPACGDTSGFVQINRSTNTSSIDHITVNGDIQYNGYTDYGEIEEILGYRCHCGSEFDGSEFDPAARTAKMMDDMRAVLADIEELAAE